MGLRQRFFTWRDKFRERWLPADWRHSVSNAIIEWSVVGILGGSGALVWLYGGRVYDYMTRPDLLPIARSTGSDKVLPPEPTLEPPKPPVNSSPTNPPSKKQPGKSSRTSGNESTASEPPPPKELRPEPKSEPLPAQPSATAPPKPEPPLTSIGKIHLNDFTKALDEGKRLRPIAAAASGDDVPSTLAIIERFAYRVRIKTLTALGVDYELKFSNAVRRDGGDLQAFLSVLDRVLKQLEEVLIPAVKERYQQL